jgi:colanic acid/amylovoran biosynthesis protein
LDNIILYAHGGSFNHGCEAIARTTIDILNINNIVLLSKNPNEDIKVGLNNSCTVFPEVKKIKHKSFRYYLTAIERRIFNSDYCFNRMLYQPFQKNIEKGAVALSIGGDNYCYSAIPSQLAFLNKTAKRKSVRTVLWGCSIEPEILNETIIDDLNRYDLITPRESITYNALLEKGINKNTHLFPDPAFILDKASLPLPEGFVENNTVGLNVSPLIMELERGDNITYKNYANLIEFIINTTDMQIALIPHVTWEHNNDLEPLTALYEQFMETGRVIIFDDQYNCMELKGFISRCRFFIGARTHATIAAYSTCVPTLVVGYSVKARGIARDIFGSEENMVIPVQSLTHEDDLVNAFKYIQENEDSIRKHLHDFMPSYIEKAWQAGEEVKKLIEK